MNTCPHCHQSHLQVKDGLTSAGSQRYRCRLCNRRYTPNLKPRGYSDDLKVSAHRMYVDGLNFRRIARLLNVHHQTVINWVNAATESIPDTPPAPTTTETVELDELFTFIGEKTTLSMS
jgi:transposase-like protein